MPNNLNEPEAEEMIELYNGDFVSEGSRVRELHDGSYARLDDDTIVLLVGGEYAHRDDDDVRLLESGDYVLACDTWQCSSCDEFFHDNTEGVSLNYRSTICTGCYDEFYFTCDNCGEVRHNDDYATDGECESCHEPEGPRLLREYGCRDASHYPPAMKVPLMFGIELEVEARVERGEALEKVHNLFPSRYLITKEDGSLDDDTGFEIVTRPDAPQVHLREWQKFFDARPGRWLKAWNTGRCGMHIHVSRSALSPLQQGKMLVFMNHPNNKPLIEKVAGRANISYARLNPDKAKKFAAEVKNRTPDRYTALNLTTRTAEFRIFRGTVNGLKFRKNIDFVRAVVDYTAPARVALPDLETTGRFHKFVRSHAKSYPHLVSWMDAVNI
jgi:hypothetical protein